MVGEKLNAFEDELDNQKKLEQQQRAIKDIILKNKASIIDTGDPKTIVYRNLDSVDDSIGKIEEKLSNQYYLQLTKIWRDETERKRRRGGSNYGRTQSKMTLEYQNSLMNSPLRRELLLNRGLSVEPAHQSGLTLLKNPQTSILARPQMLNNPSELAIGKESKLSLMMQNTSILPTQTPEKAFALKRTSEISDSNLQLLHQPSHLLIKKQGKLSSLKEFQSPLNERLEIMKNDIHDIMFKNKVIEKLKDEHNMQQDQAQWFQPSQGANSVNQFSSLYQHQNRIKESIFDDLTMLKNQAMLDVSHSSVSQKRGLPDHNETTNSKESLPVSQLHHGPDTQQLIQSKLPLKTVESEIQGGEENIGESNSLSQHPNSRLEMQPIIENQISKEDSTAVHNLSPVNEEVKIVTPLPGSQLREMNILQTGDNTSQGAERLIQEEAEAEQQDRIQSAKQIHNLEFPSEQNSKVANRMLVSMTQMGNELNKIRNLIPAESSFKSPIREQSLLTYYGLQSQGNKSKETFPEDFSDKAFERNYKSLLERLNKNLRKQQAPLFNEDDIVREQEAHILEQKLIHEGKIQPQRKRPPSPKFKSSHISHVQALQVNRDKFAERLKNFDKVKSLNHRSISMKNKNYDETIRSQILNASSQPPFKQNPNVLRIHSPSTDQIEDPSMSEKAMVPKSNNMSYIIIVQKDQINQIIQQEPQNLSDKIKIGIEQNRQNHQKILNYVAEMKKQDPSNLRIEILPKDFSGVNVDLSGGQIYQYNNHSNIHNISDGMSDTGEQSIQSQIQSQQFQRMLLKNSSGQLQDAFQFVLNGQTYFGYSHNSMSVKDKNLVNDSSISDHRERREFVVQANSKNENTFDPDTQQHSKSLIPQNSSNQVHQIDVQQEHQLNKQGINQNSQEDFTLSANDGKVGQSRSILNQSQLANKEPTRTGQFQDESNDVVQTDHTKDHLSSVGGEGGVRESLPQNQIVNVNSEIKLQVTDSQSMPDEQQQMIIGQNDETFGGHMTITNNDDDPSKDEPQFDQTEERQSILGDVQKTRKTVEFITINDDNQNRDLVESKLSKNDLKQILKPKIASLKQNSGQLNAGNSQIYLQQASPNKNSDYSKTTLLRKNDSEFQNMGVHSSAGFKGQKKFTNSSKQRISGLDVQQLKKRVNSPLQIEFQKVTDQTVNSQRDNVPSLMISPSKMSSPMIEQNKVQYPSVPMNQVVDILNIQSNDQEPSLNMIKDMITQPKMPQNDYLLSTQKNSKDHIQTLLNMSLEESTNQKDTAKVQEVKSAMKLMNVPAAEQKAEENLISQFNSKVILSMVQPVFKQGETNPSRKDQIEGKKVLEQIERDKIVNGQKKNKSLTTKQKLMKQARYQRNSKVDIEQLKLENQMMVHNMQTSRSNSSERKEESFRQEYYHKKLGHISLANHNFMGKNSKYKTTKKHSSDPSFIIYGNHNHYTSTDRSPKTYIHGDQIMGPKHIQNVDQGTQNENSEADKSEKDGNEGLVHVGESNTQSGEDILKLRTRHEKSDPRQIIRAAQKEALIMEKRAIVQSRKRVKSQRNELIKSGRAMGHIRNNSGEYNIVRLKNILTLEQMHEIEMINDKMSRMIRKQSPFLQTQRTVINNSSLQVGMQSMRGWPQGFNSPVDTMQQSMKEIDLNSTSQTHEPVIHNNHIAIGTPLATPQTIKNLQETPSKSGQLKLQGILNSTEKKIPINQKLLNSSQPHIMVDINGETDQKASKHHMTAQSFKTIVITNPWEQSQKMLPEGVQDITIQNFNRNRSPTSSRQGIYQSKGLSSMQLRSPGGGFRNSPKINQKKLSIPQTLVSKKQTRETVESLKMQKTNSVDIQIDKNLDNTIEEKLVEETFGSRDFDKTGPKMLQASANIQYEGSGSILSSEIKMKGKESLQAHHLTQSVINSKL